MKFAYDCCEVLVSTYPSNLNTTCMYDKTMPKTIIVTTTLLFIILVMPRFEGAEQIRLEIVLNLLQKLFNIYPVLRHVAGRRIKR